MVAMDRSIQLKFGANLRKYRKLRKLTQQQLAERAEIEYKYIQRLEGKNPTAVRIDTIARLAKVLKISPFKFLSWFHNLNLEDTTTSKLAHEFQSRLSVSGVRAREGAVNSDAPACRDVFDTKNGALTWALRTQTKFLKLFPSFYHMIFSGQHAWKRNKTYLWNTVYTRPQPENYYKLFELLWNVEFKTLTNTNERTPNSKPAHRSHNPRPTATPRPRLNF